VGIGALRAGRAWHALVALLALIGLLIEYRYTLANHPGSIGRATLIYFSFFTILGNILVMVMAAGFARGGRRVLGPSLRAATTLYIVVVAVVFWTLLAGIVKPTGIAWWGNMLAHGIVPAAWTIGWLAFGRHGGIRATSPPLWLIYPLAYAGWTFLHGALSGWYPYPFIDVAKRGAGPVAITSAWMALGFLVLGYIVRAIDGLLARRQSVSWE
jgi:hypothetical protein